MEEREAILTPGMLQGIWSHVSKTKPKFVVSSHFENQII
jgi:hypothetical protein